jgi:hypothetical protein
MKTKTKPRARRLWANFYSNGAVAFFSTKRSACLFKGFSKAATVPVAVIPLGNADELVDVAGDAFSAAHDGHLCKSDIVAMLTAIGVLPRTKKGRK